MGRQKAVIKARREAKRVLDGIRAAISSVKKNRSPRLCSGRRRSHWYGPRQSRYFAHPPRNEAQLHYLKAIESKQLIFPRAKPGAEKPGSAQQKRQRPDT